MIEIPLHHHVLVLTLRYLGDHFGHLVYSPHLKEREKQQQQKMTRHDGLERTIAMDVS
jgi:hypothetical protein